MSSLRHDEIQGGQHFDSMERSVSVEDTEQLLTITDTDVKFSPVKSPPVLVALICVLVAQFIGVLVIEFNWPTNYEHVDCLSIIVYIHVAVWFVMLLFDRLLRVYHYMSRTAGYLKFYRHTRVIRRTPFVISSAANVVMLLTVTLLSAYCESNSGSTDSCAGLSATKSLFLIVIIAVETFINVPVLIVFLVRTVKFNRSRELPDIMCDELVTAVTITTQHNVGYREYDYYEDMLERQADMITYLKQHNIDLARQLSELSTSNA